jgi:hypothetical protein
MVWHCASCCSSVRSSENLELFSVVAGMYKQRGLSRSGMRESCIVAVEVSVGWLKSFKPTWEASMHIALQTVKHVATVGCFMCAFMRGGKTIAAVCCMQQVLPCSTLIGSSFGRCMV